MLVEAPIKPVNNAEHPMYKTAIREALVIIDREIADVRQKEGETHGEKMYYDGKRFGFKRIRGLLAALIEEGTE